MLTICPQFYSKSVLQHQNEVSLWEAKVFGEFRETRVPHEYLLTSWFTHHPNQLERSERERETVLWLAYGVHRFRCWNQLRTWRVFIEHFLIFSFQLTLTWTHSGVNAVEADHVPIQLPMPAVIEIVFLRVFHSWIHIIEVRVVIWINELLCIGCSKKL